MNDEQNHLVKSRSLFFGAVGASLSHEINNVFAIIGELNGLIDDISTSKEGSHEISPDKLKSITGRIEAQVERGRVYTKQLNSFSHSMEYTNQDMDSSEVLGKVVDLCARKARLRRVEIKTAKSPDSLTVHGDLFDFQHILFCCIELALLASNEGTFVEIVVAKKGDDVLFQFANEQSGSTSEDASDKVSTIESITKYLGGEVSIDLGGGRAIKIDLCLPKELHKQNSLRTSGDRG